MPNWKEQFDKNLVHKVKIGQTTDSAGYLTLLNTTDPEIIKDFIQTEIIEKIVQDSQSMTTEELTCKW